MHDFAYHPSSSLEDAVAHVGAGGLPMGGGTDLLTLVHEGLARPREVVDLRSARELTGIAATPDGGVRIGAATSLHAIMRHPLVAERFPLLVDACAAVGTVALRHMGTIGGSLCQRPRCWYFRRGIPCLKSDGDRCWAADGENRFHAILGGGPCWIVHPSDPAVALTALDASVVIEGGSTARSVPITDFFVLPIQRLDAENVLGAGEIVAAVVVPGRSAGRWHRYAKVTQRGAWDFALVSLAAALRRDGDVRLVLGGVAPRPWRLDLSVEEDVAGGGLEAHDVATLADRALYDARPLAHNGYKVELAAALLRRTIAELNRAAGAS